MAHTIGKNLQVLRKQRRLSCAQVATLAGLTRSAIYAIEAGTYKGVQSLTLDKLAKALNVEPGELMRSLRASR